MPGRPKLPDRDVRRSIVDEMHRTHSLQRQKRDQMRDEMRDRLEQLRVGLRHPDKAGDVVWTRLETATPRARREVERIVAVAIALADAVGLENLSMRRLASSLGTGTTSLYRYVRNKEELLTLMVDAVNAADPLGAAPPTEWRTALTVIARAHRRQMLDHPWLASEIASRPAIGPNTLRVADQVLGIAMGMGVDAETAGGIVATLLRYTRGATSDELAERDAQRRTGMTQEEWRDSVAPYVRSIIDSGRFPSFAAVILSAEPTDEEQFEFGLQRLLDGIERLTADSNPVV
jgi:AcrR family transcriptional regulator